MPGTNEGAPAIPSQCLTEAAAREERLAEERLFVQAVLRSEASAIAGVAHQLGPEFHEAVTLLERCVNAGGTVLVTGLGKSGHVGAKISATLASLGVPSHAVHPTEAVHGDLGRFRPTDAVICISASGETEEVVTLALTLRQDCIPIIAITAKPRTKAAGAEVPSLARAADVWLSLNLEREAGEPEFLAPTSSTTATMALGDALALCLARRREFTDRDFAKRHPGGSLGGLLRPVVDVLRFRADKTLPLVPHDLTVAAALRKAAEAGRRPGAILLIDPATGKLSGIFTDGDLRRLVLKDAGGAAVLQTRIEQVMTRSPRTLPHTALVRDAVHMVKEFRQDEIPIVDDEHRPVGLLDVQDLIAMKLVKE